jgi:Tol biopolymer transport system component
MLRSAGIDTWPVWSPDGKWVYFESNRSGSLNIWKLATGGSGISPVRITEAGGRKPAIHDGLLYFWKRNSGIHRVPLTGGEEEFFCDFGLAFQPMPSGCYSLQRDQWRLVHVNYQTRASRVVAELPNAAFGSALAISPDERTVVYARQTDPGHEILLVRDWPA